MPSLNAAAERPLTARMRPGGPPPDLRAYEQAGGYAALRKALTTMRPEEVLQAVVDANLRGRGGAGFPAGLKWRSLRRGPASCLIANADEMEPGAFKDRYLMEGDPHQLIEGMVLSAYAIGADSAFIFLRAGYGEAEAGLQQAIDAARTHGYLGRNLLGSGFDLEIELHISAGRYICGEETALISALEGERAIPRAKPPRSGTAGLWGRPTVVNNVETLCNVPHIVANGAQWYLGLSRAEPGRHGKDGGTKIYGVSGRVQRPGAWELPMGTPLRDLIELHAGGMQPGYRLRALLPGGASTGFMTADQLDVAMDFDAVEAAGSRLGTGTVIVLDDRTCPIGMLLNLERFFARESCGWCTPCREGLPWVARLLEAIELGDGSDDDIAQLHRHARFLDMGFTFCAHAPGAVAPLASGLTLFEEEFVRHLDEGRCHYAGSAA